MTDHTHGNRCRPAALLFLLLVALFVTCGLHAQQRILKFDRITAEQGLSDNYVICMLQDHQGLIWFGTRDGLNRYDGTVFTTYRPDIHDPGSISDGGVECLMEDREGRLWMGTRDGGLNRFERAGRRFIHFLHDPADPRTLTDGPVTSICEQGRYLWVTTKGAGARLCRLDKETGTVIRYHHIPGDGSSISSDKVAGVVCDRSGTVWVGTEDAGLNRFDPATGGFVNAARNALYAVSSTGAISRLHVDASGTLWFWSDNRLRWLDRAAGGDAVTIGSMDRPRMSLIYAIHRDRSGRIWVGGADGGAGIMMPGEKDMLYAFHNSYDPYSLGSNRIYSILEDRSGNIWLGTDKGVSKFNRRSWWLRYYRHDPLDSQGISPGVVRNILKDRNGDLWLATQTRGAIRLAASGAVTRYLPVPNNLSSLNDSTVNTIVQDTDGGIWVGTNSGLARFDGATGTFHRYRFSSSSMAHASTFNVWSILPDRKGRLWIGTFGGLYSLDRATGRILHHPLHEIDSDGLATSVERILCLHEDRRGNIWAGTDDGLSVLDATTGSWRHYVHSARDTSSLGNNRVWYIHEDRDGIFWLATSGGGMNRFNPRGGRFEHYTEREGLAGNIACGILEDGRGRLWISTTRGLSVFDRTTRKIRNYGLQDGFYVHEFHFKSCFRDEHGYFYFGGSDGLVVFHPDSIGDNARIPDIMLTSVRIFDRELSLDATEKNRRELLLDNDSNFFSFRFAALDFTNARRNRYRYRLEGLDDRWRETDGEHPFADYTDVPPGRYTFRVLGANSDGVWNERGVAIGVGVRPAFWQTWWFGGLMFVSVGALAGGLVRSRIRRIRRQGMLERKLVEYQLKALRAQMNPHFIFNSLNSILLFMLDHDTDAAHHYLTKFSRLMRLTLEHSKNEAVPLGEELHALRYYLDLEALRLDNRFTYAIDIEPGIDPESVMIPPMLIQPYAENAIKHGFSRSGAGGLLSIDVRREDDWIVCSVTDNGIGRAAAANSGKGSSHRSHGMSITRERLEILGSLGRERYGLEVVDLTGDTGLPLGTRVNIRIPIAAGFHRMEFNAGDMSDDARDYRR